MADFNHYDLLGVPRTATVDELGRAYRKAIRQYHPDLQGDGGTVMTARINEAWYHLGDENRRVLYDRTLEAPGRPSAPPPHQEPETQAPQPQPQAYQEPHPAEDPVEQVFTPSQAWSTVRRPSPGAIWNELWNFRPWRQRLILSMSALTVFLGCVLVIVWGGFFAGSTAPVATAAALAIPAAAGYLFFSGWNNVAGAVAGIPAAACLLGLFPGTLTHGVLDLMPPAQVVAIALAPLPAILWHLAWPSVTATWHAMRVSEAPA